MSEPSQQTLVVIGGGAAGFFCAVNAARLAPSLHVILLEKSAKLLSKVKVSGGGRCNVTHACFDREELPRYYPRGSQFVKRYQFSFFTTDAIEWFAERNVKLKTESDGRMFPVSDSSETIREALLTEASRYGVDIRLQTGVHRIESFATQLKIHLQQGEPILAHYCCVACGGFSQSTQFEFIRELGNTIVAPVTSLFTFNAPGHPVGSL